MHGKEPKSVENCTPNRCHFASELKSATLSTTRSAIGQNFQTGREGGPLVASLKVLARRVALPSVAG